jgi:peptidoglycan/xylan/chitin deacetylase (PgdA/CDA1 family)
MLVIAGLLQAAPAAAVAVPSIGRALGMTTSVGKDGIALTFDDGPHPRGTPLYWTCSTGWACRRRSS